MAQFTAQGRLKPLLNSDGLSFGHESNDPHRQSRRSNRFLGYNWWRLSDSPSVRIELQKRGHGVCASNSSPSSVNKSRKSSNKRDAKVRGDEILEEIKEEIEAEFEHDELASFRGLVLDISYRPVNVVCWRRAICLEFMEKADVLEYYDQTVNSPSGSFYIPAVLRVPHLLQVVKRRRIKSTLSRKNVLFRDNFTCQYCSSGENLTIDHVIPMARGGEWTWENLVTACARCNSRKGQKTLEEANMKLMKVPKAPKDYDILAVPLTNTAIKMLRMRKGTPEEWRQYLSKPAP